MFGFIRRLLFGAPIPSSRQAHERLNKFLALPVFSSDAVSSVAYGPQEVMIALVVAGSVSWKASWPIGICIAVLVAIVATSYRQTIFAYPHGGGSYTVAKENLGTYYGLIAAASLLTDYILTVAVSIAAGVEAFTAAYPMYKGSTVEICIAAVIIVALANMRGLRESGAMFALPTYGFIIGLFTLVFAGLYKVFFSGAPIVPIISHLDQSLREVSAHGGGVKLPETLVVFLVLKAFSGGCSALTGIEAIANGIPAFKPPESKNAATTMVWMAGILAALVLGISYLGHIYHAMPGQALKDLHLTNIPGYEYLKDQTLVSEIAEKVFSRNFMYYFIQWSTALILVLAANTAFQDFPRLSSILAKDRFAPRQLTNIGDRLVFSNGILLLALIAVLLLVAFGGNTNALIPLYAVGVFVSFTLSQCGMGIRQIRLKHPGWRFHAGISFFGSFVTGIVSVVVAITKCFAGPKLVIGNWLIPTGAYFVVFLIPTMVFIFIRIHKHYITLGNQLRLTEENFEEPKPVKSTAILLTSSIHKGILPALEYARTLSHDCRALFIEIDPIETAMIRDKWEKFGLGVPLVILESPYRSVIGPVLKYLEEVKKERPDYVVTVVLPEFVPKKWWHRLLHNQSGLFLKIALMTRKDIVFTNVRYYVEE